MQVDRVSEPKHEGERRERDAERGGSLKGRGGRGRWGSWYVLWD
jgi:hypothetical protein